MLLLSIWPFHSFKKAVDFHTQKCYSIEKKQSPTRWVDQENEIEIPLRNSPKYTGVVFLCMATYKRSAHPATRLFHFQIIAHKNLSSNPFFYPAESNKPEGPFTGWLCCAV